LEKAILEDLVQVKLVTFAVLLISIGLSAREGNAYLATMQLAQSDSQDMHPPFGRPQRPEDEAREKLEKDMAKRRNAERQDEIKRDSDKLLKLATELKEYVDKSNENILSIEVVKKAEEIEKYAHSVKEKMKTSQ
jgi:hypothetical protein